MGFAFETAVVIDAPPDEVFAIASDVSQWAERITAIQKVEVLTGGPIGVGTRFRETRRMFGKEASEEMEFAEFDPPRGYVLVAESHGARYRSGHRFEPVDPAAPERGTKLTMFFTATPQTFAARLMGFLMKPLLKGMVKQCSQDLHDLKRSIEASRAR